MTFLSIVTRCYKRPEGLARNTASLARQTDRDFEQIFIIDEVGVGIPAANRSLANAEPVGDYVLVLDDDDIISEPKAIEYLKEATADNPEIVIFKGDLEVLGILPSVAVWGKRPLKGQIAGCNFITRRDVWEKHVASYGADEAGDYEYIKALWWDKPAVVWLDRLLTATPNGRKWGAPE